MGTRLKLKVAGFTGCRKLDLGSALYQGTTLIACPELSRRVPKMTVKSMRASAPEACFLFILLEDHPFSADLKALILPHVSRPVVDRPQFAGYGVSTYAARQYMSIHHSVLSPNFLSKMRCHPERRLARILRQSKSKDLRLHF